MSIFSIIRKFFSPIFLCALWIAGCAGEDGRNGVDGKDAAEVNVDSLTNVLRDEITSSLWDSLYAQPYVDTVYNLLFDNAFATAWMDSVRNELLDSLRMADFDSLYGKLYDSVYNDIYSQSVIRSLDAWIYSSKSRINGAYANLYPLMYKNFKSDNGNDIAYPLSVKVRNRCDRSAVAGTTVRCYAKKVLLKAWVEGFSDTTSLTAFVNPDSTKMLAPTFSFDNDAFLSLDAPKASLYQVRVSALENDHEIPFFSASRKTDVYPLQINGVEFTGVVNRKWYYGVWITPNMDSIPHILDEVAALLPGNTLKVYQLYSGDSSIWQSSTRVVKAVYEVLQKRGLHYIQNDGFGTVGQKINYPIEVLRSKQAVCNEFTYLMASVLEAIGFNVYLVNPVGHMFIGWAREKNSDSLDFLETTLLAHEATFENAVKSGTARYQKEKSEGHFADSTAFLLNLTEMRRFGILPNDVP